MTLLNFQIEIGKFEPERNRQPPLPKPKQIINLISDDTYFVAISGMTDFKAFL